MTWKIQFDTKAAKGLKKLNKNSQNSINDYLKNKVLKCNHPKDLGKQLKHEYAGLWRYRVGKYRIICNIEEDILVVLILRVAIRDEAYSL